MENLVHGTPAQLHLFLFLNIWSSHLGLPLMLAAVCFSKRVTRHATFINLCAAFIVMGFSASILLYAGKTTGPEPSKMLCLFQASLLYGFPILTSAVAFTLVLQMFLTIRVSFQSNEVIDTNHPIRFWMMVLGPWLGYIFMVIATAAAGSSKPDSISRNRRFFYCSVDDLPLTNTLTTVSAFILLGTIVIEIWTMFIFYKKWMIVRGSFSHLRQTVELDLPLRVLGFGLFVIVSFSLSILSVRSPHSPAPDLIIASAGMAVTIIFGTQRDILRALCFWRKTDALSVVIKVATRNKEGVDVLRVENSSTVV